MVCCILVENHRCALEVLVDSNFAASVPQLFILFMHFSDLFLKLLALGVGPLETEVLSLISVIVWISQLVFVLVSVHHNRAFVD